MSLSQGDGGTAPPTVTGDEVAQLEDSAAQNGTNPIDPSAADEGDAAAPARPDPKLCGVCSKEFGKYKCPQCFMLYCSVACNRIHKENHPPPSETNTKPTQPPAPTAQANTDPYRVLLDNQSEFARLFKKYPFLQTELSRIQQTTLPPDTDTNSRGSVNGFPQPVKQPYGKKQHTWSREAGLRQGAAALRQARTDPTDRGDGIREFCDLILYLLNASKTSGGEAGGPGGPKMKDLTEVVREEVAAEEANIIERLLQEETSDDRDK